MRSSIDTASKSLHKRILETNGWPKSYLGWTEAELRNALNTHKKIKTASVQSSSGHLYVFFFSAISTLVVAGKKTPPLTGVIQIAKHIGIEADQVKKIRYVNTNIPKHLLNSTETLSPLVEGSDWWNELSKEEQEEYLKEHPRSRKRVNYGFTTIRKPDNEVTVPKTVDKSPEAVRRRKISIIRYLLGVPQ